MGNKDPGSAFEGTDHHGADEAALYEGIQQQDRVFRWSGLNSVSSRSKNEILYKAVCFLCNLRDEKGEGPFVPIWNGGPLPLRYKLID